MVFYRYYGNLLYGVWYGAKLTLPVQNGLRKASPPQNLPFLLPGVLLPCADATQCFPERP